MPPLPTTHPNGSFSNHPLQYTDASSASHSLSFLFCLFQGLGGKEADWGESRGQPVGSGGSSSKEIDWLAAWAHFNIWKWPEASAINQHSTLCHFSSSASFSYFPLLLAEASLLGFYPAASLLTSDPPPSSPNIGLSSPNVPPSPAPKHFLFSGSLVIGNIRSTAIVFSPLKKKILFLTTSGSVCCRALDFLRPQAPGMRSLNPQDGDLKPLVMKKKKKRPRSSFRLSPSQRPLPPSRSSLSKLKRISEATCAVKCPG